MVYIAGTIACSLSNSLRPFGGTCCFHIQGRSHFSIPHSSEHGTKLQAPTYVHKNPLTLKYAVIMDDILLAHFPTQSSPQFMLEI